MHANRWMRGLKSTTLLSMPPVPLFDVDQDRPPKKATGSDSAWLQPWTTMSKKTKLRRISKTLEGRCTSTKRLLRNSTKETKIMKIVFKKLDISCLLVRVERGATLRMKRNATHLVRPTSMSFLSGNASRPHRRKRIPFDVPIRIGKLSCDNATSDEDTSS